MGVSIMGIGTKADEKTVLTSFIKTFEEDNMFFDFKFESKQTFDILINRKSSDNIFDIYSTEKGTICIISHQIFEEKLRKHFLSTFFDFLYFDISETSMSHRFALFSNGNEGLCMNVWDMGNSKRIAGDNFLNIKDEDDVFFDIFPNAVKDFLSEKFHDIDVSTEINRYVLIPKVTSNNLEPEKIRN